MLVIAANFFNSLPPATEKMRVGEFQLQQLFQYMTALLSARYGRVSATIVRKLRSSSRILAVAGLSLAGQVQADLLMEITESNGSDSIWTFSGSSIVSNDNFVPAANSLTIDNTNPDVFSGPFDPFFSQLVPTSGSVSLTVGGVNVGTIDNVIVSDANTWFFSLNSDVSYTSGQTIAWSGTIVVPFAGTQVIDNVTGSPVAQNTIGTVITSSTVPEPSTFGSAGLFLGLALCVSRRRKRN